MDPRITAVAHPPVNPKPPVTHVTLTLPLDVAELLVSVSDGISGPYADGASLNLGLASKDRAVNVRDSLRVVGSAIRTALRDRN